MDKPANNEIVLKDVVFRRDEIFRVVDDFYTRIQKDPIMQVPFQSVEDWPDHIKRLTHFWWVRLGGQPYLPVSYNPVLKHFLAGFNREFLSRWLALFHQTLETHLNPDQVAIWKQISIRMGDSLFAKNEIFKAQYEAQGQ